MDLMKHVILFLLILVVAVLLVPVVISIELQYISYLPSDIGTSFEIGVSDALTMTTILGGIAAFIFERYLRERQNKLDKLYGGLLRLVLKHVREQDEPKTIQEHWQIFLQDKVGRNTFCDGKFGDISLDDFTANVYTLRLESQIDITYGNQVILRSPYSMKVRKLGENAKKQIIDVLVDIAESHDDKYLRESAVRTLASFQDTEVVPILQGYLADDSSEVRLEAAKGLIEIAIFPET